MKWAGRDYGPVDRFRLEPLSLTKPPNSQEAEEVEERLHELRGRDGGAGREHHDEEEAEVEQPVAHEEGRAEEREGGARRGVAQLCVWGFVGRGRGG